MLRRAWYLHQMLGNAKRSPQALAADQNRLLLNLVQRAARDVPFYARLYAQAGVDVHGFDPQRDLATLPVVDKRLLRAAGADHVARNAPSRRVIISTSGSSGEPFRFQIDRDYDQWRKAQYLRAYLASGQRLTDRVLRMSVHAAPPRPWFAHFGLLHEERIDCGEPAAVMAEKWVRARAQILLGYPSALRVLASHCRERGEPLMPAPRLVFSDSELLLPETRALLEEQFRAPVLDVFGTFETDNIAFQCAHRRGFHIATDSVILEVLRDGRPVPTGECGEIVVTVLRNHTSPFIRYNLRDLGCLSPHPCPCGLPFPLLTDLQGRADDSLRLPDGTETSPRRLMARLFPLVGHLQQYQMRQLPSGRFELLAVPSPDFNADDRSALLAAMRDALEGGECSLRTVERIPPEKSGKRRSFVRLREQ